VEGCLDVGPGFFCACLQVFPCLIAGGLQLVQLCPGIILLVLQRFDCFVVFDLRLGLGLEQSDLRIPFIQLRIELFFLCFSFVHHSNFLVVETILTNGLDGLADAVTLLIKEAMKIEHSKFLKAAPWQRTEEQNGYSNGFKNKTISTRLRKLPLQVPQVRGDNLDFYP
jgi:hypothetical protein